MKTFKIGLLMLAAGVMLAVMPANAQNVKILKVVTGPMPAPATMTRLMTPPTTYPPTLAEQTAVAADWLAGAQKTTDAYRIGDVAATGSVITKASAE